MTIRKQILLTLIFFAFVPLLAGGIISTYTVSAELNLVEEEQVIFTGKAATNTLEFLGEQIKQAVKTYGFWDASHEALSAKNIDWLQVEVLEIAETDYSLDFGVLCDRSGQVVGAFGPEDFGDNLSNHPLLQRVMANEKLTQGIYQGSQGLALVGLAQMLDTNGEGEAAGFLAYGKYINREHLETVKKLTGADISLYPIKGSALVTNSVFSELPAENQIVDKRQIGDTTYLTAFQSLKDVNGETVATVAASVPALASIQAQKNLKGVSLIVLLVSTFLAVGIGLFMAKRLAQPFGIMATLLGDVGEGDLRLKEQQQAQGEFGLMLHAYNRMIQGLRVLIQGSNESADKVAQSSATLSVSINALARASEEINRGVKDVASASQDGLNNTLASVSAIGKMAAGIQEIAADSSTVLQISEGAESASREGMEEVQRAVGQMNQIIEKAKDTEQIINTLGENSQKISQVIEVITDIAGQTNLLALNAAIEAARAGEYGRGFSVVAEEVRKLAEKAAQSASEIQDILQEILQDSDEAVSSMREEVRVINEGALLVEKAGRTFADIQRSSLAVADKVRGIAGETQRMVNQSENVVRQVGIVEDDVQTSFASAQTIASAAEEQMNSMEQIVALMQSLNSMAQRLKELTQQFKI